MTSINRNHGPKRGPGRDNRPARQEEFRHLIELEVIGELIAADEHKTAAEISELVWARVRRYTELSPKIVSALQQVAQTSQAPARLGLDPNIEVAAVMRLPVIRWLSEQMQRTRTGRPADRSLWVAALLLMASGRIKPRTCEVIPYLRGNPKASWVMEYPAETSLKSLYDGLSAMCRRIDVDIANDVLVEMLREVADIRDRDGCPVHPTTGVYALVDGSALPGNFLQTNPVDEHVKKLRTRGMADNASFLRYVYEDGSTSKKWMGYKLMRLVCLATGMTIEQALLPASISEGAAAVLLVEQHFRRWPDSPLEYLVGDADYDRHSRVAETLVSCFSVMPVFQARRDRSLGVPSCAHGHMNLRNREKWPTREARRRQGLERGVPMDIKDTRLRWKCPHDICQPTDTYFKQDVRANTYLPYAGDSNAAALRVALMLRRNLVESTFSNLKNSLASQQGNDKFKSHDEAKLEWLVAWATIAHSGKRLIHELGLYEPTHRAAQQLDLHRIATRDAPGFPIDQTLVKKITDDLRETFGGARAPRHIASDDS